VAAGAGSAAGTGSDSRLADMFVEEETKLWRERKMDSEVK